MWKTREEMREMKKVFVCLCVMVLGIFAVSNASAYYFQADYAPDAYGVGTIYYGTQSGTTGPNGNTITSDDAPEFTFDWGQILFDQDMYQLVNGNWVPVSITPGMYNVSFVIDNFQVDANEDGNWYTITDHFSIDLGPIYIPQLPPLTGTYGQFSWNVDTNANSIWASYDFGSTGVTNEDVNNQLAGIDLQYNGEANGIMNANIRWDSARLELNPVPEPSTILLMGVGLGCIGLFGRKAKKKITG